MGREGVVNLLQHINERNMFFSIQPAISSLINYKQGTKVGSKKCYDFAKWYLNTYLQMRSQETTGLELHKVKVQTEEELAAHGLWPNVPESGQAGASSSAILDPVSTSFPTTAAIMPSTSSSSQYLPAGPSSRESGIRTSSAGPRLVFHPKEEVPLLKEWFKSNPKPSDYTLNRYADTLNQGTYRIQRSADQTPLFFFLLDYGLRSQFLNLKSTFLIPHKLIFFSFFPICCRPKVTINGLRNWWKNEKAKVRKKNRQHETGEEEEERRSDDPEESKEG